MSKVESKELVTDGENAQDPQRRGLAVALLGALGGVSLLEACTADASGLAAESLGSATGSLAGSTIWWVDTVLGASPPAVRTGDLNVSSAALGGAKIVIAKRCLDQVDGGGGIFLWNANGRVGDQPLGNPLSDNGGTIIVPGGTFGTSAVGTGCWQRIYSGALDVRWFGAKGNNTGNDAPAIQNAVDFAISSGGGVVLFPIGDYLCTAPITGLNTRSLTLQGQSKIGSRIVSTLAAGQDVIRWTNCRESVIRDLRIQAQGAGVRSVVAFIVDRTHYAGWLSTANTISHCTLECNSSASYGVYIAPIDQPSEGNNENHIIVDSQIFDMPSGGSAVYLFGQNVLNIKLARTSIYTPNTGANALIANGGSFNVVNCNFGIQDGGTHLVMNAVPYGGYYQNATTYEGCYSEGSGKLITTATDFLVHVSYWGCEWQSLQNGVVQVDFRGTSGSCLKFTDCFFNLPGTTGTWSLPDSTSILLLQNCQMYGPAGIAYNGRFQSIGCYWHWSTGADTPGPSSVRVRVGDYGPVYTSELAVLPGSIQTKGALADKSFSVTLANGANNNVVVGGAGYARVTGPTAAFSLTGITAAIDGTQLTIFNTTSQAMTLVHESASSTAANRIRCLTGVNITLPARNSAATLVYDATMSRWLVLSTQ